MNKIRLLDNSTINKIAAGEVVERPSSVIKELVENSIDAGAGSITIEIKDGGTTFIRVTDDGSGIPTEEVKTAFLRHATSKITMVEDLDSVFSLGFRGEALASIAAVSKTQMITKTRHEETGTKIVISGGILEEMKPWGAPNGTSITVEDIFYNVPARRKFLKKPATESGYISDIINKFILGHPEISFKFVNNNSTMIQTSGNNDMKTALYHVYGKDAAMKMLELETEHNEMKLSGLIGKPELSRASRGYENLFINGRFIKSELVSNAAEEAYKTRLMVGKFPVFVLSMTVDPSVVDVNVHPAKLEVRFRDEDAVYKLVYDGIINTFKDKVLIREGDWESKPSAAVNEFIAKNVVEESAIRPIQQEIKSFTEASNKKSVDLKGEAKSYMNRLSPSVSEKEKLKGEILIKNINKNDYPSQIREDKKKYDDIPHVVKEFSEEKPFFDNYRIIGQVFGTYWIIEQNNSMFIIDQHAAHERILFEKFREEFSNGSIVSQKLFDEEKLILSETEKVLLDENLELFKKFGFEIKSENGDWYLSSVPYIFDSPANSAFLTDLLDMIHTEKLADVYDSKLMSIATMACKAAVKARDKITASEAEEMVKKLLALKNPFSCPHGRPTIIEMTEYELEKKFKRIQ